MLPVLVRQECFPLPERLERLPGVRYSVAPQVIHSLGRPCNRIRIALGLRPATADTWLKCKMIRYDPIDSLLASVCREECQKYRSVPTVSSAITPWL